MLSTILSVYPVYYSALISIALLMVLIHIQIKIDPYEDERHNRIEIKAMTVGTITLFCGIIFDQDSTENRHPTMILIALIFLIVVNMLFVIEWLYLFLKTLNIKNVKMQLILQILASLILERHDFEELHDSVKSEEDKKELSDKEEDNDDNDSQSIRVKFDDITSNRPINKTDFGRYKSINQVLNPRNRSKFTEYCKNMSVKARPDRSRSYLGKLYS